MLLAILAALAADVTVDGAPFSTLTAVAGMRPSMPGVLQVGLVDRATSCEALTADSAAGKKPPKKGRTILVSFDDLAPGAVAAPPMVITGTKLSAPTWTGSATLLAMPEAKGGAGRISLALDGGGSHATGELTFTLCTDIIPWVAPSSAWEVTTVELPGMPTAESTPDAPVYEPGVPVRMPFPNEWTPRMQPRWVVREAQDGRTTLSVDFGSPSDDPATEFTRWADSQLAVWPDAVVTRRDFADGMGVVVFSHTLGDSTTWEMYAHVTKPGAAWMITCNLTTSPKAMGIIDEAIRACGAAEVVAP